MTQVDFAQICMRTRDWLYLIETDSHKTSITKQDLLALADGLNEPLLRTIAIGMHYEELTDMVRIPK